MDYQGQKLAELLYYWIIISFGVVGWIWGYFEKDFMYTFNTCAVGVVISVVLCVPDWPWFNKSPVKWWNGQTKKKTLSNKAAKTKTKKNK
mmetsp:Transcript_3038/g.3770  ORF Transcript_3038/g.3770 Transcript_3038/m.3770 type:complete len:90 (+) Transcript_3038:43-312(+)